MSRLLKRPSGAADDREYEDHSRSDPISGHYFHHGIHASVRQRVSVMTESLQYSDLTDGTFYVIKVLNPITLGIYWFMLWRDYGDEWNVCGPGASIETTYEPRQVKAWVTEGNTTIMANSCSIPFGTICAECDSPIYNVTDYLCVNCRV